MGRPPGRHDARYEERRQQLLARLRARLGRVGAIRASWRELSQAAEVSLSTLTHYFGQRDQVVLAVIESDLLLGAQSLARLASPESNFSDSVNGAVRQLAFGFSEGGLGETCVIGLQEGLRHPLLGPAFLRFTVEPVLAAIVQKFVFHQQRGEMRSCNLRMSAVFLLSPILVGSMHQIELGGSAEYPLPLPELWVEHAKLFISQFTGAG